MIKIGTRVGAIEKADKETVWLYGYGEYIGDTEHPEHGRTTPVIRLDSGMVVYGCDCWWDPEDETKSKIGCRKVILK